MSEEDYVSMEVYERELARSERAESERDKALAALERISGNYSSNTFAHKEAQAAIGAIKKGT